MSINKDKKWSELSKFERCKFLENTPTDCTFIVGFAKDEIKRIQCHKGVLVQCSDVFNSMFNGNYSESEENCEIRLNDVQPSVFENFVNFIYWDVVPNTNSIKNIVQLSYLSDKYMISSLSNKCQHLKGNYVTLLEFVECLKFPISNTCINILNSVVLRCNRGVPSSIYNLNPSCFLFFFERLSKTPFKLMLFEIMQKYVFINFMKKETRVENVHDTDNTDTLSISGANKIIIKQLCSMIKLEDMTAKEFVDGPMKSSLIDAHTKLNLLIKISENYIRSKDLFCYNCSSYHKY
ncbi:uncharacterized protein LOC119666558 [Teleopsis dalmanni]|uniref:uncharacterized protein LOC119666558 n=1 Tax=Teleopsis dalmanni TaxID=139649 RepID=UPI0018CDD1F0|nr:uncharacterized protein LOC119666558 [Teleopsis dalmanni]